MLAIVGVLLAIGGAGCGAHSRQAQHSARRSVATAWKPGRRATGRTDVCTARGRSAFARGIGIAPSGVRARRTDARSGAAECVFSAGRIVTSVSVSGAPEAYAVMERGAEEQTQLWGSRRFTAAPQLILGEGVAAYWFPAQQCVMTTEGVNLITATIVHWPHATNRRRSSLAARLARQYLGRNSKRALRGPAP